MEKSKSRKKLYKKANKLNDNIEGIDVENEEINENLKITKVKITSEEGSKDTIYKTGQSNSRSLKVATINGKIILNNK